MRSKKELEVELSRLALFENPSLELEQYPISSSIAAEWIWNMALRGEAANRIILDAACGTGIIGIGLLLMGAKKVFFLDKDPAAIITARKNYDQIKSDYEIKEGEFIISDISLFDDNVDIVVQNPPFGTKTGHADKKFLEKAFSCADIIYSMHKYSTKNFVETIVKDFGFKITHLWRFEFPIKHSFKFHTKPVNLVDVGLWRIEKIPG